MALDYKVIGERLKKVRIKKGYTQEKLAEILNVSIAYISRIETGKTQISLKRLDELCSLFDVKAGFILDGVSDNSSNYLNSEISSILKDCSSKNKEMFYTIATAISNIDKND